jgi:hypothetical protein
VAKNWQRPTRNKAGAILLSAAMVAAMSATPAGTSPIGPDVATSFVPGSPERPSAPLWIDLERSEPTQQVEDEAAAISGANNTAATAEAVEAFGTGPGQSSDVSVSGHLAPAAQAAAPDRQSRPDDHTINTANRVNANIGRIVFGGALTDNVAGSPRLDFDFFSVGGVSAGQTMVFDIDTNESWDSELTLYNEAGEVVAESDDSFEMGTFTVDSRIVFRAPASGSYHAVVGRFTEARPTDPFSANLTRTTSQRGGAYRLTVEVLPPETFDGSSTEDDGSRETANPVGLSGADGGSRTLSGTISDPGDADHYRVEGLAPGQQLQVEVFSEVYDTPFEAKVDAFGPTGAAHSIVSDTDAPGGSAFQLTADETGDHTVAITAARPNSGLRDADYAVRFSVAPGADTDVYLVDLRAGDVLSVRAEGEAGQVTLTDANGAVVGQATNATFSLAYPTNSPLLRGGSVALSHVAPVHQQLYVRVDDGVGSYRLRLRADRPGLENAPVGTTQKLFIDFDGAPVPDFVATSSERSGAPATDGSGEAGSPDASAPAQLSPMSDHLEGLGVPEERTDEFIDRILAIVDQRLRADVRASAINPSADLVILNSRDHADPRGRANVSRAIVGGSAEELGVDTVGLAEAIDPGNFDTEQTAVVLLAGLASPSDPLSLRRIPVASPDQRMDLAATAVGAILVHEVSHLLGTYHSDPANELISASDTGGNLLALTGVGADGVFGTADDLGPAAFVSDTFDPDEPFTGTQNSPARLAWGLSTGKGAPVAAPGVGCGVGDGRVDIDVDALTGFTGVVLQNPERRQIRLDLDQPILPGTYDVSVVPFDDGSRRGQTNEALAVRIAGATTRPTTDLAGDVDDVASTATAQSVGQLRVSAPAASVELIHISALQESPGPGSVRALTVTLGCVDPSLTAPPPEPGPGVHIAVRRY